MFGWYLFYWYIFKPNFLSLFRWDIIHGLLDGWAVRRLLNSLHAEWGVKPLLKLLLNLFYKTTGSSVASIRLFIYETWASLFWFLVGSFRISKWLLDNIYTTCKARAWIVYLLLTFYETRRTKLTEAEASNLKSNSLSTIRHSDETNA